MNMIERLCESPEALRLVAVGALLLCGLALAWLWLMGQRRQKRSQTRRQGQQAQTNRAHAEPWPDGWRGIPKSPDPGGRPDGRE